MTESEHEETSVLLQAWIDSGEDAQAVVGRAYVIERARLLWNDETVVSWLNGRNAFLGGACPADVVTSQGVSLVVGALDQEAAGAYA